jgi:outer membrane protein OmpA-like peptidoglycan-associated protein
MLGVGHEPGKRPSYKLAAVWMLLAVALLASTVWLFREGSMGADRATVLALPFTIISATVAVIALVPFLKLGGGTARRSDADSAEIGSERADSGGATVMTSRKRGFSSYGLRSKMAKVIGVVLACAVAAGVSIWLLPSLTRSSAETHVAGIACPISQGPLTLVISGRSGSPRFFMSETMKAVVAQTFSSHNGGPVQFVSIEGTPGLATQTPVKLFRGGIEREDYLDEIEKEGGTIRARTPEADLLGALDVAARATLPTRPATILVDDSGLSTRGGVAFDDKTTIEVDANEMVEALTRKGYLPDLSGLTVVLVGIGEVGAPQKPLRPAQRRHLVDLWTSIGKASGAACVASLDQVRTADPDSGLPFVSPIPVPPPPATPPVSSSSDTFLLSDGGEVSFKPDTAQFVDPDAARLALAQVAKAAKRSSNTSVKVVGTTANVGPISSQIVLSKARAQAIADVLVQLGVERERLVVEGLGSRFPEYLNDHGPNGELLPGPANRNRTVRITIATH